MQSSALVCQRIQSKKVDGRCLHKRGLIVAQTMPENLDQRFMAGFPDRADSESFIRITLLKEVIEGAIAYALANVKRQSVPRVDVEVNIGPQHLKDFRRKLVRPHASAFKCISAQSRIRSFRAFRKSIAAALYSR